MGNDDSWSDGQLRTVASSGMTVKEWIWQIVSLTTSVHTHTLTHSHQLTINEEHIGHKRTRGSSPVTNELVDFFSLSLSLSLSFSFTFLKSTTLNEKKRKKNWNVSFSLFHTFSLYIVAITSGVFNWTVLVATEITLGSIFLSHTHTHFPFED